MTNNFVYLVSVGNEYNNYVYNAHGSFLGAVYEAHQLALQEMLDNYSETDGFEGYDYRMTSSIRQQVYYLHLESRGAGEDCWTVDETYRVRRLTVLN